jgi:hypothetical protein
LIRCCRDRPGSTRLGNTRNVILDFPAALALRKQYINQLSLGPPRYDGACTRPYSGWWKRSLLLSFCKRCAAPTLTCRGALAVFA